MRASTWAVAFAVVLLAACGGPEPAPPAGSGPDGGTGVNNIAGSPNVSNVTINGDASDPANVLAIAAIDDLEQYWANEFPELYGEEFQPVSGGFYAVYPSTGDLPPCAQSEDDIAGNAFYCGQKDVIAWDAEGFMPALRQKFGDFVIPVILAHEYGHAVQARSAMRGRTVTTELQADCFAGAWAKHAQEDRVFDVDSLQLDSALAGVLVLRDAPGTSSSDPDAHGSGFDRVSAFQDGYDNGTTPCKAYRDNDPMALELPFNDRVDEAREGNAPYDEVVAMVPVDLEDYWSKVYPELADGDRWQPVKGLEAYHPGDPPSCGDESAEGQVVIYCPADDYVGWDNEVAMPTIYDTAGDYAVATLLATQYGLAALNRLGDDSDLQTSTLRSDCLAGAYSASVFAEDREGSFQISPGDLDEGIEALLVFRGEGDRERQGAGFALVRAFREGFLGGAPPCLDYRG